MKYPETDRFGEDADEEKTFSTIGAGRITPEMTGTFAYKVESRLSMAN